jgi:hypothetical protein
MLTVVMQERPIAHRPRRVIRRGVTNNPRGFSSKSASCSATVQRGIVSCKAEAASSGKRHWKRGGTDLLIETGLLSQEALYGLIDDWIVPQLVERLIRASITEPTSDAKG